MAFAHRHGLPVAVCVESATPHEVKLASTLIQMIVPEALHNLIVDNAYGSDKLDAELRQYGIELIAAHRNNRRRWKVERLFAWLQNFRRLVVRYERYADNFLGILYLLLPNSIEAYMRWLVDCQTHSRVVRAYCRTDITLQDLYNSVASTTMGRI